MKTETVTVGLADRSYPILAGAALLERAGEILLPYLKRQKTVVVTDENVMAAQGPRLKAGLEAAGVAADFIILPPGESTKSFSSLEMLLSRLLDLGVERSDLVIAFGGGVVGDITGFAAAILRRGCRFAQAPTTLLAQVDSAVGGKTAVNVKQGKNLIGAFHQPTLVIADTSALATLPDRQRRAGYAEVVKYGAIDDAAFFEWLEENGASLLAGDETLLQKAVVASCKSKARIVEADEREAGIRALLNLGHTFGHAIEAIHGYSDTVLHGEAVAIGMMMAFSYSVREGECPQADADRFRRHLHAVGLPTAVTDIAGAGPVSAEELFHHMQQDKKVTDGKLTLILTRGIGKSFIAPDAPSDRILDFLRSEIER